MGSLNSEAYLGALIKSILGGALIEHGAYWGVLLLNSEMHIELLLLSGGTSRQ